MGGGEIEQPIKKIIIPEDCREKYVAKMENKKQELSSRFVIVEKSELIDDAWHVNENDTLIGYYGSILVHCVIPMGIISIGRTAFNDLSTTPKTIILNKDLEYIYGLIFYDVIDEIWIPNSVKYVGSYSIYATKVYLYRNTETHDDAFKFVTEIIYLD